MDPEKHYFLSNFLGRRVKDYTQAKEVLMQSKLYDLVEKEENPEENHIFDLALAFHQIMCVEEAEKLYRRHLDLNPRGVNCTLR